MISKGKGVVIPLYFNTLLGRLLSMIYRLRILSIYNKIN